MELPDIALALKAIEEGELERTDLPHVFQVYQNWQRAKLKISCGEILAKEFRIPQAKIRKWEKEVGSVSKNRVGKYTLSRRIGQGGMGIVFEASHPNFDRSMAIKILPPSRNNDSVNLQRFLAEVKSVGQFNHPNIVHAYDAGIDGELAYLVMEFVDGENLFQVFQRRGRIRQEQAIDWLIQSAKALLVLEESGWLHGDVKPSNFILASDGTLKLADLGLCRAPGAARDGKTAFGSPPYIAREVLHAHARIDNRADLFSLGASFYHLLAGRPHIVVSNVQELIAAYRDGHEFVPLQKLREELDSRLCQIVNKLLAYDPDDRYLSSDSLLSDLLELQASLQPESASEKESARRIEHVGKSSLLKSWQLWLVACVLLAGVVYGIQQQNKPVEDAAKKPIFKSAEAPAPQDTKEEQLLADWQQLMEQDEVDFEAAFKFLLTSARQQAQSAIWRKQLEEKLVLVSRETLAELQVAVAAQEAEKQFVPAVKLVAAFPVKWRHGSVGLEVKRLELSLAEQRTTILRSMILHLNSFLQQATPDYAGAKNYFEQIYSQEEEEQKYFQAELKKHYRQLPWEGKDTEPKEVVVSTALADAELLRQLRAGILPEEGDQKLGLDFEELLAVLHERPEMLKESRATSLLQYLYQSRFLVEGTDRQLYLLKKYLGEKEASWSLEAEAKSLHLLLQAREHARSYDAEIFESFAARLIVDELSQTMAAKEFALEVGSIRQELEYGILLRAPLWNANVKLDWQQAPVLSYVFDGAGPAQDWRHLPRQWRQQAGAWVARNENSRIESFIPLSLPLKVSWKLRVPAQKKWNIIFGFGDQFVGCVSDRRGELGYLTGPSEGMRENLHKKNYARPMGIKLDSAEKQLIQISLEMDSDSWILDLNGQQLELGQLLSQDEKAPTEPLVFIRLELSSGIELKEAKLNSHPEPAWLKQRSLLIKQKQ